MFRWVYEPGWEIGSSTKAKRRRVLILRREHVDNVNPIGWAMIFLLIAFIHVGIPLIFALVTGLICGWRMSRISIKRGLTAGLLISIPSTVIYGIEMFRVLPVSPRLDLMIIANVVATILLCFWWSKQIMSVRDHA